MTEENSIPPYRARYIYVAADTGYTVPEGYTLVVEGVDMIHDKMFLKGWLYPTCAAS